MSRIWHHFVLRPTFTDVLLSFKTWRIQDQSFCHTDQLCFHWQHPCIACLPKHTKPYQRIILDVRIQNPFGVEIINLQHFPDFGRLTPGC